MATQIETHTAAYAAATAAAETVMHSHTAAIWAAHARHDFNGAIELTAAADAEATAAGDAAYLAIAGRAFRA